MASKAPSKPTTNEPRYLPLAKIVADPDIQPRAELDQSVVDEYAELMQANKAFPPLEVIQDGGVYLLFSGFHRLAAAKKVGKNKLLAMVEEGDKSHAIWRALSTNHQHGLRRSNADKRRAVEMALQHGNGRKMSDRAIAEYVGVGHVLVNTVRHELEDSTVLKEQSDRRKGRDGRITNTANIGGQASAKPKSPELFTCDCGQLFSHEVWHCGQCDHHWQMHETTCKHCTEARRQEAIARRQKESEVQEETEVLIEPTPVIAATPKQESPPAPKPKPENAFRFGSLCSGIEGASVAWRHLNWQAKFFAEIEPFCCSLLSTRFPDVPNLGDINDFTANDAIDLLVGGTPCQSFSVNGLRKGLDDARGNLALQFCRIVGKLRPRWVVWENVPGVLSTNQGRDFGAFLGALGELGYGWCYRVLDARYFGVAQRRRRVFVVAHIGGWQPGRAVLGDAPTGEQDVKSARQERKRRDERLRETAGEAVFGWTGDTTPKWGFQVTPTLRSQQGGEGVGVISRSMFRKLTTTEWERLQGFPDGYTNVMHAGKPASDRQRQKAIGNSFCVNVVQWIGERINFVESILQR